jgi:hypothetical protein
MTEKVGADLTFKSLPMRRGESEAGRRAKRVAEIRCAKKGFCTTQQFENHASCLETNFRHSHPMIPTPA